MGNEKLRVLLIGEFSSFHSYLKDGLEMNGCEVMLASQGDAWKKIPGSNTLLYNRSGKTRFQRVINDIKSSYEYAKDFKGYDVVQLINPSIYFSPINKNLLFKLFRQNRMVSLVSAGCDLALYNAWKKGKFDYYVLDYSEDEALNYNRKGIIQHFVARNEPAIVDAVDIIIPANYEYAVGYEGYSKLHSPIPMPVTLNKIAYHENVAMEKIVVFHGINRPKSKGTPFIKEALDNVVKKYPNELEVIMDGKMPFEEYLKVMEKTNVVIDQCCGYGYGINANIAMAMGKVVLSGARKETLDAYGIDENECPVFGIKPDVTQIEDTITYLIENRNMIAEWGRQSRAFMEEWNDSRKVAEKYIEAWKSTGLI